MQKARRRAARAPGAPNRPEQAPDESDSRCAGKRENALNSGSYRTSASLITVISALAALYRLSPETLSLIESAPSRQHSRAHLMISAGPLAITAKLSWYMCALQKAKHADREPFRALMLY